MRRHLITYMSVFVLLAVAVSCKKDTEVNVSTFKIEHESIEATAQSVVISGEYDYGGRIDGITLIMGRATDLLDGDSHRTLLDGTLFRVEVSGLRTNTTYYYRYSVDYGGNKPFMTEIKSFTTLDYNLPAVKTMEVESVGVTRAEVSGEVLGDGGGDAVTLRGICWSTHHNPSVGDEYVNAGEGIGTYTCELTNLQPEKTYYARAFAGNSKGIAYGEEKTFVTMKAGTLAEVVTIGITGNAMLSAMVEGEVLQEGAGAVLERGICYGKEHYPMTGGLHVSSGSGAGVFSSRLTNLEAGATYYVRAYAINSLGTSYGEELSFEALTEMTAPVVVTNSVSNITESTATGSGMVIADGGNEVTERGICWSTEEEPTIEGTHVSCGSGLGEFSSLLPHLTDMTTYYVRAYAQNAIGLSYGATVSFTVGQHEHPEIPSIGQVNLYGNIVVYTITADGGAEVMEHGVCWGTAPSPSLSGNHLAGGAGTGEFSVEMTDLQPSTTYYVRVYATNSVGTAYSMDLSFTTATETTIPTVTTGAVTNITQTTATVAGEVTGDGGATVTERGICWSTSPGPTVSDTHQSNGPGTGSFTVNMTGLTANTTYYVRAYAVNSVGTGYGSEVNFTTSLQTYTISVSASPSNGGSVSGGGTYSQGENCTVTATANTGYEFTNWTENGSVVSTNASYTFTVSNDRTLVANFGVSMPGDEFIVDFESGMPAGWTTIDADGDGYNWGLGSVAFQGQANGHGGSSDLVCSSSYDNFNVLYPDNYLVSPQVTIGNGSTFSFWACAQDASYSAEHFGVAVSTTGTNASDFTMLQEWTMTAKGSRNDGPRGTREQGNWYQYTVDLSIYAGQQVYIAIRHFNCSDMFYLDVDDIELTNGSKK